MHGLEVYDNLLTAEQCQQLIDYFNDDDNRKPGLMFQHGEAVNSPGKRSTDLACQFFNPPDDRYNAIISPAVNHMVISIKEKYPFLDYCDKWQVFPYYNIQYYTDDEGFFYYHCEQGTNRPNRMMAWMLYLNNAQCGTEFPYQEVELKALQGRGAMWSAAWTHPHKGVTPNVGDKYIVTGWCEFI